MKPPKISNVRIAVVEKDDATRSLLEHVLMYCVNRAIQTFSDSDEAWKKIESGEIFDIVISSVESGQMNGLELLIKIKETRPETVCIITSSLPNHESSAKTLGADAFLGKPFSIHHLFDLIRAFVAGPEN